MQGRTAHTNIHHARAHRGTHGFALIEVLAASVVLGLVGTAVVAGVFTLVKADSTQQASSDATVVARNFADALSAAPYQDCAAPSAYSPDTIGLNPSTTATVTVNAVTYWKGPGNAPPSAANPSPADWTTAFATSCSVDAGLQRITFTVTSKAGASNSTVTRSVLKRFNGSLPEPPPDPPPGGRKCVIVASGNVTDTWVDETAGKQAEPQRPQHRPGLVGESDGVGGQCDEHDVRDRPPEARTTGEVIRRVGDVSGVDLAQAQDRDRSPRQAQQPCGAQHGYQCRSVHCPCVAGT